MNRMKSHPLQRLLLAYAVLIASLFAIMLLQFTSNTSFTHSVGSMIVSGHYAKDSMGLVAGTTEDRSISGALSVVFGGLEFDFNEEIPLSSTDKSTTPIVRPTSFSRDFETINIRLSDDTQLTLKTVFAAGKEILRMSADFAPKTQDITIPFEARPDAIIHPRDNGQFTIEAGGQMYLFTDSVISLRDKSLRLSRRSPVAQYSTLQAQALISPAELVPTAHRNRDANAVNIADWTRRAFRVWEREMDGTTDEATVVAYIAESRQKNNYHVAVSTISRNFLENGNHSYRSSPYLGKLEAGLQTLEAEQAETLAKLLRLAKDKNPAILLENHLVEFLHSQAPVVLDEDIPVIARNIEVPNITPDMAIQVLEAWTEWKQFRPASTNPFERLTDQSAYILTRLIRPVGQQKRLPIINDRIDMQRAIRLYTVLASYGSTIKDTAWERLADSILLSILSFSGTDLSIPAFIDVSKDDAFSPSETTIPAAELYLSINRDTYLPKELLFLSDPKNPIRILTAARNASASVDARGVSLGFPFTPNDTHYAIVRGIKPFSKLQINGMEVDGSPRFERSETSSWRYLRQEQTLLLKLRSPDQTTRIRIVYVEDQPKPVPAPQDETEAAATETPQESSETVQEERQIDENVRRQIPLQWRSIPRPPQPRP